MSNMYKYFAYGVACVLALFTIGALYVMLVSPTELKPVFDSTDITATDIAPTPSLGQEADDVVPRPKYQTQGCVWEWFQIRDVGVWGERCTFNGVEWSLKKRGTDTLVLMIGEHEERRAIQLFQKPNTRPVESIVNQIAEGAPPECVMQKNDVQSGPGRLVYEFVPTGALKRSFEKSTTVPPDPCGSYGISATGQRLFEIWEGHEDVVIFLDYGPDGSLFEYETLTFIR